MAGDDERMSQIETRVITPMDAAKILGKNYEKNRNIRQSVVKRYANDMKSGRWSTDACPPIVIAKDGSLIDGQHRLSAVMQAGVAVIMDVKTGVDFEAYKFFDCGATRSVNDLIDVPDRNNVSALARLAIAVSEGKGSFRAAIKGEIEREGHGVVSATNAQVIDYIDAHSDELYVCTRKAYHMYKAVGCGMKSAYNLFAWVLRWLGYDDELELFIDQFKEPLPFSKTVAVCKQTISRKYVQRGSSPNRVWMMEQLLYAFDNFNAGKELTYFKQTERVLDKYEQMVIARRNKDGNAE